MSERTTAIVQKFSVPMEYSVVFTRGVFDRGNDAFLRSVLRGGQGRRGKVAVFLDGGLDRAAPELSGRITRYIRSFPGDLDLAGPVRIVPGGEAVKNDPAVLDDLYRQLQSRRMDRHSYVVAVGGGAVLDLVGFAAATFHRGVRHIRVPTTVLAQNDAGVGVKNGRNLLGTKNLLGTFQPPWAVIVDSDLLRTLPRRDLRAGYAEALKVALIRDRVFFDWLDEQCALLAGFDPEAIETLVRRCALLHMNQIVQGADPFEAGSARPLDFGHWAAHKLETLSGHALRHGEAVAIGVALDSRYSVLAGLLPESAGERIEALLQRLGFTLWHPALEERDPAGRLLLLEGLREFREHLGGELCVTLLAGIGRGVEVDRMEEDLIERALEGLRPGAEASCA